MSVARNSVIVCVGTTFVALPTALPAGVSGSAYRYAWPAPGDAALGLYGPKQSGLTGTLLYLKQGASTVRLFPTER